MKNFLNRFKYLIASAVAVLGIITPVALQAVPASAATQPVINDWTGHVQGLSGPIGGGTNGLYNDLAGSPEINLYFVGHVTDSGGGCWPFTCGNGANSYFNGDSVYVWYGSGSNNCVTATLVGSNWSADMTNSACGNGHLYSYLVGHAAFDGLSTSRSWADVGATDAQGGTGEYLHVTKDDGTSQDNFTTSAGGNTVSFRSF